MGNEFFQEKKKLIISELTSQNIQDTFKQITKNYLNLKAV